MNTYHRNVMQQFLNEKKGLQIRLTEKHKESLRKYKEKYIEKFLTFKEITNETAQIYVDYLYELLDKSKVPVKVCSDFQELFSQVQSKVLGSAGTLKEAKTTRLNLEKIIDEKIVNVLSQKIIQNVESTDIPILLQLEEDLDNQCLTTLFGYSVPVGLIALKDYCEKELYFILNIDKEFNEWLEQSLDFGQVVAFDSVCFVCPKLNSNNKNQVRMRVANDSKQWITEKCGTNTPPPTPPKSQSKGNKKIE